MKHYIIERSQIIQFKPLGRSRRNNVEPKNKGKRFTYLR